LAGADVAAGLYRFTQAGGVARQDGLDEHLATVIWRQQALEAAWIIGRERRGLLCFGCVASCTGTSLLIMHRRPPLRSQAKCAAA